MKKYILIISLVVFALYGVANSNRLLDPLDANSSSNQETQLKRYDVKSGTVEYVTTISGKIMGSTTSGNGTSKLFFKDWGAVELKEEESVQTNSMKFFGREKTETTNEHTINKLDKGMSYSVDFDAKKIYASCDMAMDMTKAFSQDDEADVNAMGISMLEGMGGKIVGTEKVLGYTCDVWSLTGGKQWIYKGVVLKFDMTLLGIHTVTKATTAKFDISVANSHFDLPDFPIQKTEDLFEEAGFEQGDLDQDDDLDQDEMNEGLEKVSKMSFEEWKRAAQKDDEEMQEMSDEELHQTYDMIQKMVKMRLK